MKERSEQAYKTELNTSAAELDIITTAGENLWLDQGVYLVGTRFCLLYSGSAVVDDFG